MLPLDTHVGPRAQEPEPSSTAFARPQAGKLGIQDMNWFPYEMSAPSLLCHSSSPFIISFKIFSKGVEYFPLILVHLCIVLKARR